MDRFDSPRSAALEACRPPVVAERLPMKSVVQLMVCYPHSIPSGFCVASWTRVCPPS
jgi:hypothetical protein